MQLSLNESQGVYDNDAAWVNACSMIYEPEVFALMDSEEHSFEKGLFGADVEQWTSSLESLGNGLRIRYEGSYFSGW